MCQYYSRKLRVRAASFVEIDHSRWAAARRPDPRLRLLSRVYNAHTVSIPSAGDRSNR
jgi:hypothetical protein